MEKLVNGLTVRDYNEVNDMIFELLNEHYGIERYSFDNLEKDVEYVVGTINTVKLGSEPHTLKHLHHVDGRYVWSDDVAVTEGYEYAEYYRLDKMNHLCENVLSGINSETYQFHKSLEYVNKGKASDFFDYGEQVEIIADCPLKGLKGQLAFVSEESLQIEVHIEYEGLGNCSSYFTGYTQDIKKANES